MTFYVQLYIIIYIYPYIYITFFGLRFFNCKFLEVKFHSQKKLKETVRN